VYSCFTVINNFNKNALILLLKIRVHVYLARILRSNDCKRIFSSTFLLITSNSTNDENSLFQDQFLNNERFEATSF